MGNIRPVLRRARASCRRVTPASTVDIEIRVADAQDAVHLAEIEADAAAQRVHVPFERGSRAKRHDRQLKPLADARDFRDLGGRSGEADDVGRGRGVVGLAVAVMFADGVGVRSARAEQRAQLGERAGDGGRRLHELSVADQAVGSDRGQTRVRPGQTRV